MKFFRNMGLIDQLFRSLMGLALIYFGPISDLLVADPLSEILMVLIGILTLGSALSGYCPVYHVAGINTYRR